MALSETPEGGEEDLRGLHACYIQYLQDMRRASSKGMQHYLLPREDFNDFAAWWSGLSAEVQAMFTRDFRKGYARVVAENDQKIIDTIWGKKPAAWENLGSGLN